MSLDYGHDPPHALKGSYRGRRISDFRVSNLESKLTIKATTWDEKATTCIKRLIAWPYDIGFLSSGS